MGATTSVDSIELLVDPARETLCQSAIAPGMGILYRYHPDSGQRLAEGFPRFAKTVDGRLVLARSPEGLIVGYAVIAKPDPRERWGNLNAPEIWELGMIEVARGWRRRAISRRLLRACFADGMFDDRIVLATAYSWHWDLKATGLAKSEYREVLVRLFGSEGFKPLETNEPNIQEDPANQLMARIGSGVKPQVRTQFLALLQGDQQSTSTSRDSRLSPEQVFAELLARYLQVWNPAWWLSNTISFHRVSSS